MSDSEEEIRNRINSSISEALAPGKYTLNTSGNTFTYEQPDLKIVYFGFRGEHGFPPNHNIEVEGMIRFGKDPGCKVRLDIEQALWTEVIRRLARDNNVIYAYQSPSALNFQKQLFPELAPNSLKDIRISIAGVKRAQDQLTRIVAREIDRLITSGSVPDHIANSQKL